MRSHSDNAGRDAAMRVRDPIGGAPDLVRFVRDYESNFRDVDYYLPHLKRFIAGYSRGDDLAELRDFFPFLIQKIALSDQMVRSKYGENNHLFAYQDRWAERFRDALVLLSFGLCLRAQKADIATILACCDRGDPLLETLAGAAAPGLEAPGGAPAFPFIYDGLYAALYESATERERHVREYLEVWYQTKMEGFSFKDAHLLDDQGGYVGYWCFEAAGTVAALGIEDGAFANHPHYPRDLVAFYLSSSLGA